MSSAVALQFFSLLVAAFATSVLALIAISRIDPPKIRSKGLFGRPDPEECVFLFDGSVLLDATENAQSLLSRRHEHQSDWEVFAESISDRFPALANPNNRAVLSDGANILSDDKRQEIEVAKKGNVARIRIVESTRTDTVSRPRSIVEAEAQELATLRGVAGNTPCLIWKFGDDGNVSWANGAYFDKAKLFADDVDAAPWPPENLFPRAMPEDVAATKTPMRQQLKLPGAVDAIWYDVFAVRDGDELVFTAIEVSATVRAETTLADFIQTLTKTFAQLKTGLAIFDKQRQLTLFNPALTELTQLQPDFLAHKPTLQKVLNALRDKNMIPEPKDYKVWRERIEQMESASRDQNYQETWSLPDGRTFRITGQPHPDGALALLMEDISAEISLARQFRYRLENYQAVFDTHEEAMVVFSPDGQHLMSNLAYATLWDTKSGRAIAGHTINDATRIWAEHSAPSPVWGDLREFATRRHDRAAWSSSVRLSNGRSMSARITPLAGGATMVSFSHDQAQIDSSGMIDVTNQIAERNSGKVSQG